VLKNVIDVYVLDFRALALPLVYCAIICVVFGDSVRGRVKAWMIMEEILFERLEVFSALSPNTTLCLDIAALYGDT